MVRGVATICSARRLLIAASVLCCTMPISGCTTIRQYLALSQVDFDIERASDVRVAGIELDGIRSYSDLTLAQVTSLAGALTNGALPLEFTLHLGGENPAENGVSARLVRMGWTLLLEDRETISGNLEHEYVFEPGVRTDVPIDIRLDLVEFFEHNARDMFELALNLAGQGGSPKNVKLRALPTIETQLGPIVYSTPITIVSQDIGR